jgi:hypothetical protein
MTAEVFTPEDTDSLRVRLREVFDELMRLSDVATWPTERKERYQRLQECRELTWLIADLQRVLDRGPRGSSEPAGDGTAELVADAKRRGDELRQRMKGPVQ